MEGCNHWIKTDGKERILKINCRDCVYGMSLEDSEGCMGGVIRLVYEEPDIDSIVLSDLVEREYDRHQTMLVKDLAALYEETRGWSFKRLVMEGCDRCKGDRSSRLEAILEDLLSRSPILAFSHLLDYIREEEDKKEASDSQECVECWHYYIENLEEVKRIFESSRFIGEFREDLHTASPSDRRVYRRFFSPLIRPYFSTSRILLEPPPESTLVLAYKVKDADIRIYLPPDKPEHLYFVSPPEYNLTSDGFEMVNKARERMVRHRPESMDFADPEKAREYFRRLAKRNLSKVAVEMGKEISKGEIEKLANIIAKYTAGMGILEVLLEDPNVQDVYINAPTSESPVCINHSEVEDCATNIYLTEDDTESLISRFRARSGRAFSEAEPTLDLELPEYGTRIAAIGRPLSPDGLAFALRRQKTTPWTLPQFIENGTITAQAAGLLSFLIDGQATMLVTGSRGSGKTSLLISLLGELMQKLRILTIEDTLEIPVPQLSAIGYRIQRLKIQSAVGKSETELTPQEALATALRLGESVLVIGEVRGPETKILYESMRVGAAGNAVLGTIHGASSQSVFERVVYDIGIPASSFKATDIVVTSAPIRKGGGLRSYRRVLQISEVSKEWYSDNPDPKDVFRDLMFYNPAKDRLEPLDGYSKSDVIATIAEKWNLTYQQALENIDLRAKIKQYMVDYSREKAFPEILEIKHVAKANNRFRMLNEEYLSSGKLEYGALYGEWRKWFDSYAKSARHMV